MEGMINQANSFLKNDKSGLGDAINNAGGGGEAGERKEGECAAHGQRPQHGSC
jgi:hypothetical protein